METASEDGLYKINMQLQIENALEEYVKLRNTN